MNGYFGDVSGSDGESSQEVRTVNGKHSTTFDGKEKASSKPSKHSRKSRAHGSILLKQAVESPIHPEINFCLTKHVFSKDFPDHAARTDVLRTKTVASDIQELISVTSARTGQQASRVGQETPISSELQQTTSTIIPCEPKTTFSKRHRRLEEGLALTQIPRLLIEAESPHRVVHANAAFTQTIIGTSSNIQRWFVKQSSSNVPETRSLTKALHDIVPNRDVQLVIYPVDGREKVSHYLVETKDDSRKKRRRSRHDEPHRAIG